MFTMERFSSSLFLFLSSAGAILLMRLLKFRDISASIKFVSFTSGVELNRWCHQEVKALLYLVQYAV